MKISSNAHFKVFSAIGKYEFITATVSIDYQEKYSILEIDFTQPKDNISECNWFVSKL